METEHRQGLLMKAVLPELLRNPNSMKTLIELSELGNKKK